MFNSLFIRIITFLMSFSLAMGTFVGSFKKPTTESSDYYRNDKIKNVIYLIGDGMGFNHLEKTKSERKVSLAMDSFEILGHSRTRSTSNKVTDSAAGGTALSSGVRTANSVIGAYNLDKSSRFIYPKSITELCIERGMKTGVVTSDTTSGATPASFSAHSSDRDNTEDITNDQLTSDIDIIWGTANGVATKDQAEANGFEFITTYSEMMALEEGSRSFAQFTNSLWTLEQSDENTPTLEQMAEKAVDLLDNSDEGFFLMIEGAHIDKHSHSNDSESMTEALYEFDKTVEAMLEYAKADGETLVVVTADHETGAIKSDNGNYVYTSDGHSAADVPVLVYGSDKLIESGETLNNYEIPIRISYVLGFDESQFPLSVSVKK